MTILRPLLLAALLALSACGPAQVAGTFKSWCRSADNCSDNTRPSRP